MPTSSQDICDQDKKIFLQAVISLLINNGAEDSITFPFSMLVNELHDNRKQTRTRTRYMCLLTLQKKNLLEDIIDLCPDSIRALFVDCLTNVYGVRIQAPRVPITVNRPLSIEANDSASLPRSEATSELDYSLLKSFCMFFNSARAQVTDDVDVEKLKSILQRL